MLKWKNFPKNTSKKHVIATFWIYFTREHTNFTRPLVGQSHIFEPLICTLQTVQCKLQTVPVPSNGPAIAPVHFILYIEHCTLQALQLHYMLHIYHFTSKICLSGPQDLHGKITLNINKWKIQEYFRAAIN